MNNDFKVGDWVYYVNPAHHFHMSMFQIQKLPATSAAPLGEYKLVFGCRAIEATEVQMLPKGQITLEDWALLSDPSIREDQAHLLPTYGNEAVHLTNLQRANAHEGHEIVENHACGKTFQYCRQCKVEV